MRIERVPLEEIFELRWAVLRPGQPKESADYPEDHEPGVFHMAAYDDTGRVVGCVTFFPEPLEGRPAHRFRGMGTDPGVRGQGYGAALLTRALGECAAEGADLVWCNGRTSARGFYERLGFTAVGEEFATGATGIPHYVFVHEIRTGIPTGPVATAP